MQIPLRSNTSTKGRKMAGARSLWRANGMTDDQMGKPIIAVVNSFTQLVPGHAHLHSIGQHIKNIIEQEGCFAAEFNTIAIDDGIAMGHQGMLYSLPSRDLIADSVEYMCNAHCVDAMVCISNCDKITPGMLMAAMRLNIPTVFVSGGPMEAGKVNGNSYDLVDVIVKGADTSLSDKELEEIERAACPTCGSCSGMFTANSMNCLTEALGLSLPGNGTLVATHSNRLKLFERAAKLIVELCYEYYHKGNTTVLPRSIASREAFLNAMRLDIAMGGSTNTVLHLLAIANEAKVDFTLKDIDSLSRTIPTLCKVAPSSKYHIQDVHRAGGVAAILGELYCKGLLNLGVRRIDGLSLEALIDRYDVMNEDISPEVHKFYKSAPENRNRNLLLASQEAYYDTLDLDRTGGCIRSAANAYSSDGGLAVLYGNIAQDGCVVKTAGVDKGILNFKGKAKVCHSQEQACNRILNGEVKPNEVVVIIYEGPKGGPGMQEMLYPTSYLKSVGIDKQCALITDGRFSGGTSGLSIGHISPEAAAGGNIGLVRDGDIIEISIPERSINVLISDTELADRRNEELKKGKMAFQPNRQREIPASLKVYSHFVSSADKGAIREVD